MTSAGNARIDMAESRVAESSVAEPASPAAEPAPPVLDRTLVLVGLMGAGKSSIGRRLAQRLGVDFLDADTEIETAAGRSTPEILPDLGEPAFRAGRAPVLPQLPDVRAPPRPATAG